MEKDRPWPGETVWGRLRGRLPALRREEGARSQGVRAGAGKGKETDSVPEPPGDPSPADTLLGAQ